MTSVCQRITGGCSWVVSAASQGWSSPGILMSIVQAPFGLLTLHHFLLLALGSVDLLQELFPHCQMRHLSSTLPAQSIAKAYQIPKLYPPWVHQNNSNVKADLISTLACLNVQILSRNTLCDPNLFYLFYSSSPFPVCILHPNLWEPHKCRTLTCLPTDSTSPLESLHFPVPRTLYPPAISGCCWDITTSERHSWPPSLQWCTVTLSFPYTGRFQVPYSTQGRVGLGVDRSHRGLGRGSLRGKDLEEACEARRQPIAVQNETKTERKLSQSSAIPWPMTARQKGRRQP